MTDRCELPQLPEGSRALILSEANMMFDQYFEHLSRLDPEHQSNPMLMKAKEYTSRFANMSNKATVQKIREMLAERQLSEFELAQLASLNPGEVDEARALVPSLQDKERLSDTEVQQMLQELTAFVSIQ